ncbi:MAG: ABC transporter ATP-binding protein [Myxococcales bacterium]|nr:ABC transporter ATP-binding protein [Myxococcales bacterium]
MTALIELEHVYRTYVTGDTVLHALDDVSLAIPEGQFVAIMGASGSGKSTLLNVIGCLDRPTRGIYRLAGKNVTDLSRTELAEIRSAHLGFVFQSFNLLPRTSAVENVELPLVYAGVGARERTRRALAALERVGLGNRAQHTPGKLSGGQQQRVAIARALVNNPRLILADEPTGQLDTRTSQDLMRLLQDLAATGITIVMVTHEADIGSCAQRVITMRDGRIAEDRVQVPHRTAA